MPTSITKYQISLKSANPVSPPWPATSVKPLAPDLPIFSPHPKVKDIVNPANHPTPPPDLSHQPLVHAQSLDASAQTSQSPNPASLAPKNLLPNLINHLRENPLTTPINSGSNTQSTSNWKTHMGIGIASFFLGASIAIILMLYLY